MKIIKFTVLLFLISCSSSIFCQSGWTAHQISGFQNLNFISYKDSLIGYVGGASLQLPFGRVLKTTNGGINWFTCLSYIYSVNSLYFVNPVTGFSIGVVHAISEVRKTLNGGGSWDLIYWAGPQAFNNVYFIDENTGYLIGSSSNPNMKTTNGGSNWEYVSFGQVISVLSIIFVNYDTGFISGTNSSTSSSCIGKTTNQGVSWSCYDIPSPCKKLSFADINTGFGVCENGQVIKTTNAGNNWVFINLPEQLSLASLSFPCIDTGYVLATSAKVLKTTNGGINWITQILPQSVTNFEIAFSDVNRGIISSSYGYIFRTTSGGEPVGIKIINKNFPVHFRLFQNYPNPFNPDTRIRFNVASAIYVSIKIYDPLGRELETPVNETKNPGAYEFSWSGGNYSSGIYFCVMNAGEFTDIKKMVLIK